MVNIEIRLNPITKLRIYREAKKIILPLMDSDKITPERADEILWYVKNNVVKVETPEMAKEFYEYLSNKFSELKRIKNRFDNETWEKAEKIVKLLVENLINKWEFDFAMNIMDEIKEIKEIKWKDDEIEYIENLSKNMPNAFSKAVCEVCKKEI